MVLQNDWSITPSSQLKLRLAHQDHYPLTVFLCRKDQLWIFMIVRLSPTVNCLFLYTNLTTQDDGEQRTELSVTAGNIFMQVQ